MMKWTLLALAGGGALWAASGHLPCRSCCSNAGGADAVSVSADGSAHGAAAMSVEVQEIQPLAVLSPAEPVDRAAEVAPSGVYLEARDATVWGGACHISSQAATQGRRAAMGWAFTGGSHAGVDLAGTQVVAVLEGSSNLQGA